MYKDPVMPAMKTPQPGRSGMLISDALIGMSDGLIVPFALTIGLSRVSHLGELANISLLIVAAGALIMGAGAYFTNRNEISSNQNKGLRNYHRDDLSHKKTEEAKNFYANLGLSEELREKVVEDTLNEKKEFEALLEDEENVQRNAAMSGLTTGIAYATGGILSLCPYLFSGDIFNALRFSIAITLPCLLLVGYLKGRRSGLNPLGAALRLFLTGALAALGAYYVGGLFHAS